MSISRWSNPGVLAVVLLLEGRADWSLRPVEASARPALESTLERLEYHASWGDSGLQAPNRRQNLRTYFGSHGIRVHDRTAKGSPELLALEVAALGRGDGGSGAVPAGELHADGARVEIRRKDFVEWYENRPEGLEQGFTLATRPHGDSPLRIELAVRGARARQSGPDIELLADATGQQLRYGKLVSVDATGRVLPGAIEVAASGAIVLRVDDDAATYPVTIDPLVTSTTDSRIEANQASAHLGFSVAGAGDVNADGFADIIVGAPDFDAGQSNEGAAFVFHGSAAGIPSADAVNAAARLEANLDAAGLGTSVAGAGDVNGDGFSDVVVGAPFYNAGEAGEGAAFLFLGGPGGVGNGNPGNADARFESNQADANLGFSVAGAGDVNRDGFADVIVGARYYDAGQINEGAAFIFHGSGTGMTNGNPANAATQLESDEQGGFFGAAVSSAGDVNRDGYDDVIVGAYAMGPGATSDGAAFIFHGGAAGILDASAAQAQTALTTTQAGANFGSSVAALGDFNGDSYADVVVGATAWDGDSGFNDGAAFIFVGGASGVAPAVAAPNVRCWIGSVGGAGFGSSVAGAGDLNGDGFADLLIGSPGFSGGNQARVVVVLGYEIVFRASASFFFGADQPLVGYGGSVASAGDVNGDGYADMLVGAPYFTNGASQSEEGAAFLALGGMGSLGQQNGSLADRWVDSSQLGSRFGEVVANAGDVNGDGRDDLIVGAPGYDSGLGDAGAAFVFTEFGQGSPPNTTLVGNLANSALGTAVASAGDVNGDGYDDVIVGARAFGLDGAAFIFLGGATGIANANPTTAATRLTGDQASASFGESVAGAGDVNGDGFGDVVVGARQYDDGESNEGAVFAFLGGPGGIVDATPATAATRLEGNLADGLFGRSLESAGDVNGDGFGDIIVGASGYANRGAAFVFHGSPDGLPEGGPADADAVLDENQALAGFGYDVSGAGDVNRDGFDDVIVGAIDYTVAQTREGAAFVYLGSASGVSESASATLRSNQAVSGFGTSVAAAGDLNADGYADVLIGAPFYTGSFISGAAFPFYGGPAGVLEEVVTAQRDRVWAPETGSGFGVSVAGIGDLFSDGTAAVAVGARFYDTTVADAGKVFLFSPLPNAFRFGRPSGVSALRAGSTVSKVPGWGSSGDLDEFNAQGFFVSAQGMGRAKLEVEACPRGTPFGAPGCTRTISPTWVQTIGGTSITHTVGGLEQNRLYHWRGRARFAPFSVTQPGVIPPPFPPHGPWRYPKALGLGGYVRTASDSDLDGRFDAVDNCPTVANANQADGDADGVGDACDNCTAAANPRVPLNAGFLRNNPWATLTGGQRDDDHDGYGNRCDAKFPGVAGSIVGSGDLAQFRASNGKGRTTDTCGTLATRPCAIFDLDESSLLIGTPDLSVFRSLNGKLPGPRCAACPLPCYFGAQGECGGL